MRHRTLLGSLLVAAGVLLALAPAASATNITSPVNESYQGNLDFEAEGHTVLDNPIAEIKCASTIKTNVEENPRYDYIGETKISTPVFLNVFSLSFTGCTDSWHVTVVSAGEINVWSNGDGTADVMSFGATIETTRFGVSCRYKTASTTIGTLTSTYTVPTFDIPPFHYVYATLHIEASLPFHSGSFLCGSNPTAWTGSYRVSNPAGGVIID